MGTDNQVALYLARTAGTYLPGQPEYYARLALEQALLAHREGNYGIGAVAVVVRGDEIREFPNRNAMFTGTGVVDHAETRTLLAVRGQQKATRVYGRDYTKWTRALPEGISIFGTLEPCPMCDCAMINAGAVRSISTVPDGELVMVDGVTCSSGGAMVLGKKKELRPQVWSWIQQTIGLQYSLLETHDTELRKLSRRIFEDYREAVDRRLAARGTNKQAVQPMPAAVV